MLPPEESDSILEPTEHNITSAEAEVALHRSRPPSGDTGQIGLPSEPVTINIGNVEGKDIQFGDRHIITYVTVDAIKIRKFNERLRCKQTEYHFATPHTLRGSASLNSVHLDCCASCAPRGGELTRSDSRLDRRKPRRHPPTTTPGNLPPRMARTRSLRKLPP